MQGQRATFPTGDLLIQGHVLAPLRCRTSCNTRSYQFTCSFHATESYVTAAPRMLCLPSNPCLVVSVVYWKPVLWTSWSVATMECATAA